APAADGGADSFDVGPVGDLLDGRWRELRRAARDLALDPDFQRIPDQTVAEHRERVLTQLHLLAERGDVHRGFPAEVGGGADPGGHMAGVGGGFASEPALQIRVGATWGLVGAPIQRLGVAERLRRWLPDAMSVAVPGCFAMAEVGHGSDVASLATTAVYD